MPKARFFSVFTCAIVAAALSVAAVAPAQAAVVTFDDSTWDSTFTAGAGEANNLEVNFTTVDEDNDTGTPEIDVIEYRDYDATVTTDSIYCFVDGTHTVYCLRDETMDTLATIRLGDGNDTLRQGSPGRDAAYGEGGNDLLVGREGDDLIDGGPGNDTLEDPEWTNCSANGGAVGADTIVGGDGTDELKQICRTSDQSVTLDGQANDGAAGEGDNVAGDIEIIEGPGSDYSLSFVGNDLPNTVNGGGKPSTLIGNGGDDKLYGGVDNDQLDGGPGNDTVEGWGGADTVDGGVGSDDLSGEGGSTITDGTGGADTILARDGFADTISCGTRADRAVIDQFDLVPAPGGADTCESVERESVAPGDGTQPPGSGPPAPGPSGPNPPAPPIVNPGSPVVTLGTTSATVRKGAFLLALQCAATARCAGTVSVRTFAAFAAAKKRKRAIAAASFSIPAGTSKKVRITLNRVGRKLIRKRKALKVVVKVKLAGRPAKTVRITLRRGR